MLRPKTVMLYLIDGIPQGRIKASLSNWTGVCYLLPRTDLIKSKDRSDLQQSGVYLLFGADDDGNQRVYIGQARKRKNNKGVLGRIMEHRDEEKTDYWTQAVAIVTSNNALGPTEISYLEHRFTGMAKSAGRYVVTNGNDPSMGAPTEEKQAELDEFIDYAHIVIGALGFKVFESVNETTFDGIQQKRSDEIKEQELTFTRARLVARGKRVSDGFVVLAGSQIRPEDQFTASVPPYVCRLRAHYADRVNENFVLTRDTHFSSPSTAASFVSGASVNGRVQWKTEEGKSLKQIEDEEAAGIE